MVTKTFAFLPLNNKQATPEFRSFILSFIEGIRVAESARGHVVRIEPTLSGDCSGWLLVCEAEMGKVIGQYLSNLNIELREI